MAFNINDLQNLDPSSPEYSAMKKRMGQQFPSGPSSSNFDNNQFLSTQNMGNYMGNSNFLTSPNMDTLQSLQQNSSTLNRNSGFEPTSTRPEPQQVLRIPDSMQDKVPSEQQMTNSPAVPAAPAIPAAAKGAVNPNQTSAPSAGNGQQMPTESDAEEINSLNTRRSKLIDQLAAYPPKIDPRTGTDLNREVRNQIRNLIEEVQKKVSVIHQKQTKAAREELDAAKKTKTETAKAEKLEKAKAIVLAQYPGLKDAMTDPAVKKNVEEGAKLLMDQQRLDEARAYAPSKEETAHNARVAEQDKAAGTELGKRQSPEDFMRGRRSDYDKKAYALAANGEITQEDLQRILSRPANNQAMDAIFAQKTGVFTDSANGANQRGQNPGAFVPPTDTVSTPRPGATSPQIQLNDPGLAPLQDNGSLQPSDMVGPPRPLEQTQRIGSSAERMADIMKPRRPKKV